MGRPKRLNEVSDLCKSALAMGYDREGCYEFVMKFSSRPRPTRKFIMRILEEVMEG